MEQFFTSLSKRQTILLLTSLAFGGSDAIQAFDHLAQEEEELLKHRAQGLLQIPRDKRVPLLVQEIKRLFTQRRRQLAQADPKRLAELLGKERPAMVEVMLKALPADLADAVRLALPAHKPVQTVREVKPEILSIMRWKLEEQIKQKAAQVGTFRFTDLLALQPREVLAICDRMGARVLATAVAGLADDEREAFLGQLPPDQRALASKAAEAGKAKRLTESDAKLLLELHDALENPSTGMRSAGAQRIARAAIAQAPEFAQRLVERHKGDLGKSLARWVKEEKNRPVKADGGRMDIVEQMERLAKAGIIDRPVRLPPPARPPAPPPPEKRPSQAALKPVGTGANQAVRPGTGLNQAARPSQTGARPAQTGMSQRMNAVAERALSRPSVRVQAAPAAPLVTPPRRASAARAPAAGANAGESTDPGKRVLRDGRPLERGSAPRPGSAAPRVPTSGSPVQSIPKKKERPEPGARSPVLKGTGRGPSGRSS